VVVDDADMNVLIHTPHVERPDAARIASMLRVRPPEEVIDYAYELGVRESLEPVRIPARPSIGLVGRVCAPIRKLDTLLGYIWLMDEAEDITAAHLDLVSEAAKECAEIMYAASSRDAWSTAIAEQICRDLLSDSPMMRSTAARTLADRTGVPVDAEVVVIVIAHRRAAPVMESAGTELAVAIDAVRRHTDGFVILWAENPDGSISVIFFDRITPGGSGVQERHVSRFLHALLEQPQFKESSQIIVGVGPAKNNVVDAWHSGQRAREALQVQRQMHLKGALAVWDELGVYQLLVQLDSARLSPDLVPPALTRLFAVGGELLDTLETYLDTAGDVNATTAALHIHRSTLYYRLQKIHDDFGIDWRSGSSRLHIHVSLKLLRLHAH
jgi:Sugar diacid utilization regulator